MTWLALPAANINRMMCADWLSSKWDGSFFPLRIGRLGPSVRKTWRLNGNFVLLQMWKMRGGGGGGGIIRPWIDRRTTKTQERCTGRDFYINCIFSWLLGEKRHIWRGFRSWVCNRVCNWVTQRICRFLFRYSRWLRVCHKVRQWICRRVCNWVTRRGWTLLFRTKCKSFFKEILIQQRFPLS